MQDTAELKPLLSVFHPKSIMTVVLKKCVG